MRKNDETEAPLTGRERMERYMEKLREKGMVRVTVTIPQSKRAELDAVCARLRGQK